MKIGILGLGYVGSAVAWTHRNHKIIKRDPKFGAESASLDEIYSCDAVYVCVPTPMLENGYCDDSYVKSALSDLKDYKKVIICKSTIPPSIYDDLKRKQLNMIHAPEFLTAANATEDYENSDWVLIGGERYWAEQAASIIASSTIKAQHYHITSIKTASLFKYIANSFLASKVTFMNDMYHLSQVLGIDWKEIKEIAKNDSRLGNSHWDVPGPDGKFGFGGACFPKDVSAIIEHANDHGIKLELLDSVRKINLKHRNL